MSVGRPALCQTVIDKIRRLRDSGKSYREIQRETGVPSLSTIWEYCNDREKRGSEPRKDVPV
jgi:DNA invertase Pin-like site-specific DNA recombinase